MSIKRESASDLRFDVSSELWFPSVTVFKQLLFVVKQLFVCNGGVLKIWSLDDSINRASGLTKSTINAFGHVNIILGGSSGSIWSWLTFNCDGFGWASGSTQFTGDTSLISRLKYLSSPVAYLLNACSPLNFGDNGPFSYG